jgi:beta-galactosidase
MTQNRLFLLAFLLVFNTINIAQFKITQLSSGFDQLNDSLFLGLTSSRNVQNLNSDWKVFFAEEPDNFSQISFPINFTTKESMIFEKQFDITAQQIVSKHIKLNFLGINYSAEIYVNNAGIYKHPGGEIPFSIDLPDNILNVDSPNTLRIKIQYQIDSENTIPLLQRFLFPKNFGGILRDVYLSFRPKVGIDKINYSVDSDKRPYEGRLNFKVNLKEFSKIISDSLLPNYDGRFKLEALLQITDDTSKIYYNIWNINPLNKDNFSKDFYVRLRNIVKWTNESPLSYQISIKLTNGGGFVFDEQKEIITLFDVEKRTKDLFVNNAPFEINGVTYIRSSDQNIGYQEIEKDIRLIKESGFNTIRFSKSFPHPYAVHLCNKYGLFSLIELPLNSIPERFAENSNFEDRVQSFLQRSIKYYDVYPNVIGYGVGGSYLSNSKTHTDFVSKMNSFIKTNSKNRLTYSSFIGLPENNIADTDLFGLEIYASDPVQFGENFSQQIFSDSVIYFISEATYPTHNGATNGYLNNYSFEGQAKFFNDIITITRETSLEGFILNTMFDFKGDYSPMFSGFNEENQYNIGILSSEENESRISYNLIKSRLSLESKISIPIGSNDEDAPLFFIIAALIISVIIALLINSKRKFREDATRALLRPYNFFADIRDQRILSSFHSNILMFLLAGSNALLVTILLYFLKNNILIDKLIISFGNYEFSSVFGYLAWNPQKAFIYIFIATIIIFLFISFLVHLSSFFVKTRVLFSSVYSVAIWSFLPLALLVPIEAVLYKILLADINNYAIYLILILFLIWNIQRFLKGIYVIFDVRPLFIYTYAFLTLALIVIGFGLYFQYTVSAFDYISLAIKQYIIL